MALPYMRKKAPHTLSSLYISPTCQIWTGFSSTHRQHRVEAMGVDEQGQVCFLGNIAEIEEAYPTEKVPQHSISGSLVAGGVDSHQHLHFYSLLYDCPTLQLYSTPKLAWDFIENYSFSHGFTLFLGAEEKHDLSPQRLLQIKAPCIIVHRSLHRAYANLDGLSQIGLSPSHPQVEKGYIIYQVMDNVFSHYRGENLSQNILSFQKELIEQGITEVHDMRVMNLDFLQELESLREELFIDYQLYTSPETIKEAQRERKLSSFVGIKSFADGAIGTKTAKFKTNYQGSQNSGVFYSTAAQLEENFTLACRLEKQIACHGIGAEAIRRILLVLQSLETRGENLRKPRIEHFECPYEKDIDTLIALGGAASIQPNFSQDNRDYGDLLGERVKMINPLRSFIEKGLNFATGSDGMPSGYRECLLWSIKADKPEQRMTLAQAVHHSTQKGHQLALKDKVSVGGLALGEKANFVLFANPLELLYQYPQERITNNWKELRSELDQLLPIEGTYIRGKIKKLGLS